MKILGLMMASVATALCLGLTAQAETIVIAPPSANCISQAEMAVIAADFKQFKNISNKEFCYDGSTTSNLLASLMFMRHTAFAPQMTPSKDELFSGKFASNWYDYFIGRIDTLEVVQSCPKGVVAYVYAFGGKTMYACPLALTDTFSSLDRASVFMHEARHIDGYPHITCSKGPRQGIQGACDRRIAEGGSYAVTVETYAQLAQYATDIHPALKAYARSSAVVYADEAFENPVRVDRTEKLLLVNSDLDFKALNPQTGEIQTLGKIPNAGKIVRRGQHLVLFPEDKTVQSDYVYTRNEGKINQTAGEHFAEYNAMTPDQRANFVDYHSAAQWTVRVFKTALKMTCDPKSPTVTDLQIPAGDVAANMIYPNGYDRGVYTALLATVSGNIYEVGCANQKAYIKASPASKLDQNFKRVYKTAGKTFALSNEGQVFDVVGGRSQPITSITDRVTEITPWQTFEFFETKPNTTP